jgi:hypothetical protein
MAALAALLPVVPAHAHEPPANWHDTGIAVTGTVLCLTDTQPGVLFVAEEAGTVAYNWLTGTRTALSQHTFNLCGPNGLLFAVPSRDIMSPDGPTPRLNTRDSTETIIAHAPTQVSADGSMRVYALHDDGRLWASTDGGATWSRRGQQLPGKLTDVMASAADARAIYAVSVQHPPAQPQSRHDRSQLHNLLFAGCWHHLGAAFHRANQRHAGNDRPARAIADDSRLERAG